MKPSKTPKAADLRESALRLLARREHSRFELARKLVQAGFAHDDIDPLLNELAEKNWLSDQRFAESYVANHRARAGGIKLAYDLSQRGLDNAVIDSVLSEHYDSELERAREVWQKKFGLAPNDKAGKARQMRFLQGRGFSIDVIRSVIKTSD